MAGRTPNGNTRRTAQSARSSGGSTARRNGANTRSTSRSARGTARGKRRTVRRRSPSLFSRPGFWLFVCIVIIILVLIFRGCGSEDMTDGATAGATEDTQTSGPVVLGNTEGVKDDEPESEDDAVNEPSSQVKPQESEETDVPDESEPASEDKHEEQNGGTDIDDSQYSTFVVQPGIYLIGSDIFAGTADVEVYSGTGSLYVTDDTLNLSAVGNVEGYTSSLAGISLKKGEYLTVSGNLSIKLSYSVKYAKTSAYMTVGEQSYTLSDLGGGTRYTVLSEGGDVTPGIYMIEAWDGNGTVYVPDRGRSDQVDFMIGVDGGYVDSVNYVILNEGDTVTVEGCTVTFIEMKEG